MISKLLKPKAPKIPDGASISLMPFNNHVVDGQGNPVFRFAPSLDDAIRVVAMETRRLRGIVESCNSSRRIDLLTDEIDATRGRLTALANELELKQRQFMGGVTEIDNVQTVNEQCRACRAELSGLLEEMSRKERAEDAAAKLQRILSAVS